MTDGSPCAFPDCGGTIDGGYCNNCGRAPRKRRSPAKVAVPAGSGAVSAPAYQRSMPTLRPASLRTPRAGGPHPPPIRIDSGRSSSHRSGSTRLGLGLVEVPPVPTGDPAEALMDVAEVPEGKRYCSSCNKPVGRSRNKRPGRTEGFCPHCRTHFSFTPKLAAGDLLAGQYEVLGALAHGGLGWVYLARDRAVSDRWVVLKGLLDTGSEDAAIAALAERRFLAAIDHSNIVEIHNFVTHEGAGYIVMEYVGGKSLKTVLQERRAANGGEINPLPVDQAIAYVLGVLPALSYLHGQGLVYCDMKPDNVILTGDSLKIIDLGGVRPIDDDEAAIYGTTGYQAPEVAEFGPTPRSDLYTIGRTLAVLTLEFRGYQSTFVDSLPPPDEQPLLAQHESLHRFLLKATAVDPTDRFGSAEEMAEQMLGVLREEAAVTQGEARPAVSTVFGPDAMGAGLGDRGGLGGAGLDWRLLPRPKVHPDDPGAGFLLGLAESDPGTAAAAISSALMARTAPASTETLLRLARAQLELGSPEQAGTTLDSLADMRDWRLWWHRGLVALAAGKAVDAVDWLDPIYTELPGEVAPKLALGMAHEMAGELVLSADLYDRATWTDPSYVSGGFGLARVRVVLGDREGAVEALQRVPASSSAHADAQVAAVRALAAPTGGSGAPSPDQLTLASTILERLDLDPLGRAQLDVELFQAGLSALTLGGAGGVAGAATGGRVLDRPFEEPALREGLEAAYRELARHAATTRERIELVDNANRVRPRTLI
jgi:serine/threonine-protein kinase PknG